AEDGIRRFHVTGVQTCALPISELGGLVPLVQPRLCDHQERDRPHYRRRLLHGRLSGPDRGGAEGGEGAGGVLYMYPASGQQLLQIGRASCRERVKRLMVAVSRQ